MIADAYVKIPATIVLSVFFLWRWRRWTEPALLIGALVLEVAVFLTSSVVVDRARPPISRLDPVPPTGSFPSGHAAAAVAFYGAIAIVVFWHTRSRVGRTVAVAAAVLIPLAVAASRMYRGMHNLSDVVVGLLVGILSLAVTWLVVRRGPAMRAAPRPG
jgi:undecaprenyl-diphosphatase